MNNAVYSKKMECLKNRIDVRLVRNKIDIKTKLYVTKKIFDNDLVANVKVKSHQKVNKPPYVGVCILNLNKALMF